MRIRVVCIHLICSHSLSPKIDTRRKINLGNIAWVKQEISKLLHCIDDDLRARQFPFRNMEKRVSCLFFGGWSKNCWLPTPEFLKVRFGNPCESPRPFYGGHVVKNTFIIKQRNYLPFSHSFTNVQQSFPEIMWRGITKDWVQSIYKNPPTFSYIRH